MICRIADLITEVPEAGGMAPRLESYAYTLSESENIDVKILEEKYKRTRWPLLSHEHFCYMESGYIFYLKLMLYGGMMLHSSAVELDGRAYLFSGPSGMGKSTHARLWEDLFPNARIFNDDKPALRQKDGVWYAYGTPWCGKNGININISAPIAGICFLKRGETNEIRRLSKIEAASAVFSQTLNCFASSNGLDVLVKIIDRLIDSLPIYELRCKAEPDAALLSHKIMCRESLQNEG